MTREEHIKAAEDWLEGANGKPVHMIQACAAVAMAHIELAKLLPPASRPPMPPVRPGTAR